MRRIEIPPWLSLAILAGVLGLLYAPLLVGEKVLFWGLPSLQFFPWREFTVTELQAGRVPFWNPYSGGGAPLFANYQTALLYPPNWLYVLLSPAYAMSVVAVLHVLWAGLGMWVFGRRLGMSVLGQGVSTLSFALAGYHIARLGSFPTANAVAWIPWLFWAVLCIIEDRSWLYTGVLGLVTSMLLLTGHAQTAWYALLGAGLFTLWGAGVLMRDAQRAIRLRILGLAALGVVLGAGTAAPQLLFTAELLSQSQRAGGVSFETVTNISFPLLRLLNFIAPDFFGSAVDGTYLTPDTGIFFEERVYIGLLPLIAALAAFTGWVQRRNLLSLDQWRAFRSVPFWVVLAVLGIVLAQGSYGSVYRVLYDYVPTFDAFREPVRWMIWPVFALTVLAGIGIQNWGRTPRVVYWTRLSIAGGLGLAGLGLAVQRFAQLDDTFGPVLTQSTIATGVWLVGCGVLTLLQPQEGGALSLGRWQMGVLVFVALNLTWANQGLNPTVPNTYYRGVSMSTPQERLYWFEDYEETVVFERYFTLEDYRVATRNWPSVRRSLLPNLNMLDNIAAFNNFDPLVPRYHVEYVEMIEAAQADAGPLLRAAGISQVYGEVQPTGWRPVAGDTLSYQAPEEAPLVRIVSQAQWEDDNAQIRALMRDPAWNPAETVILHGEEPGLALPAPNAAPPAAPLSQVEYFEVLRDTPDYRSYRVVTDGSGYLVLANTWYPGWQARIDGETVELERANMSFMAVELPAGSSEVTFQYMPTVNFISLLVSLIALGVALAFLVLGLLGSGGRLPQG